MAKQLGKSDSLIRLLANGREFNFFKLLSYLETIGYSLNNNQVFLRPNENSTFPEKDIAKIEQYQDKIEVFLTFMGLYGVDSPLPSYFFDKLRLDNEGSRRLKFFLDILNHHLYRLYYQTLHHKSVDYLFAGNKKTIFNYLHLLTSGNLAASDKFCLAKAFSHSRINLVNLQYLINKQWPDYHLSIEPLKPQWVKNSHPCCLSNRTNFALNHNISLGKRFLEATTAIDIKIETINFQQLSLFFVQDKALLIDLLQRYLKFSYTFRLYIVIHGYQSAYLGKPLLLGRGFGLGHHKNQRFIIRIH